MMKDEEKKDCISPQPIDAPTLDGLIENLMNEIRERLVVAVEDVDDVGDFFEEGLDKRQTATVVNGIINENPGRDIKEAILEYRYTGKYLKFTDLKFMRDWFFHCPVCFLDGHVFTGQYFDFIEGYRADLRRSVRRRIRSLYGTFMDDILYYVTTRDQDAFVMNRAELAVRFLMSRLAPKREPKTEG